MSHTEVENLFFYQINKIISAEGSVCIQSWKMEMEDFGNLFAQRLNLTTCT